MAEVRPFTPVKLVCGILFGRDRLRELAKDRLASAFGDIDHESQAFPFDLTDYYASEMGAGLKRSFVSFRRLVAADVLAEAKLLTNAMERRLAGESTGLRRPVNIDPGILSASSLIMATTKDFAHRVPLRDGIYAHLELLFTKTGVRFLDWTYPDVRREGRLEFFLAVRKTFLGQVRSEAV
jgi:hypothetical protein